jgi:ribonuclease P protein component
MAFLPAKVPRAVRIPLSADVLKAERSLPSKHMLPKNGRVSHALFATIMERGRSIHSLHFSFRYFFEKEPTISRISVVVPKKVSSKATFRNKLRRKIYPIVRIYKERLPHNAAGIVFIKKDIAQVPRIELIGEVKDVLQKAFNIVL